MSFHRQKIDCTGKPYRHVGWHDNGKPKFVRKPVAEFEAELGERGLVPEYDNRGMFVGAHRMASLPMGAELPDHMRDADSFAQQVMRQDFFTNPFWKKDPVVNPCEEIAMTPAYGQRTLMGHKIYDGPSVEVTTHVSETTVDCEIYIKQKRCLTDRKISFGPLSCQLSELFSKGYWLETHLEYKHLTSHGQRSTRVYLTDGVDRYRLYKIDLFELQAMGKMHGQYDLGAAVSDGTNLLQTHSSARYPKPVIQKVEVPIETDPFEVLAKRYPRKKTKPYNWDTMVGNRTLRERFEDHVSNR